MDEPKASPITCFISEKQGIFMTPPNPVDPAQKRRALAERLLEATKLSGVYTRTEARERKLAAMERVLEQEGL